MASKSLPRFLLVLLALIASFTLLGQKASAHSHDAGRSHHHHEHSGHHEHGEHNEQHHSEVPSEQEASNISCCLELTLRKSLGYCSTLLQVSQISSIPIVYSHTEPRAVKKYGPPGPDRPEPFALVASRQITSLSAAQNAPPES
jgi:hypothetical protein